MKTQIPEFYKLLLIALLLLLGVSIGYSQVNNINGIKFNSQNVPRSQKTSIFLNEGNPLELKNSFSISFDICFWDYSEFGPILRIEDEKGNEIRIVYIPFKDDDTSHIQIIEAFNKSSLEINIPKNKLTRNNWYNFKLYIDRNKKSLKAFWDNNLAGKINYPIKEQNQFKFAFGIKNLKNLNDFDVPAIAIKNIIISENYKIKYQWELNPFKENPLADKISGSKLKVFNPVWLYQDHQKWKHVTDYKISANSISSLGVAFDSLNSRLFIDGKDSLIIHSLISGKDSIIKYKSTSPAYWAELFYDYENQYLYSYFNGLGKVSIYDIMKNNWIVKNKPAKSDGHYFGSTKFSYPKGSDLYLLGGYGWYKAKKDLFRYDFVKKDWQKVQLKKNEMTPRAWFTFGEGFNEGEFLIYGGLGNESGNQEDGFKNYNDFFLLNLNDSTIKKIEYPEKLNPNYSALAYYLYLDKKDSTIYFLAKAKEGDYFNIYLNKLNLNTGTTSKVGDTFWRSKIDKWIYHYLHYNKATNEFISVIFDSTTVELYSINYPPISETAKDYTQNKNSGKNNYLLILIPIIVLISGAAVFVYMKKRNSNISVSKSNKKEESYNFVSRHIKNSINLFGGLWIYDNNENEISQSLSPKIKEIFLLILIRSLNNHHSGITSEELSSIIWPDASPESVKSNRGVAINKLRKTLSSVQGIDLEFSDKLWFIKFNNGSGCDYLEFLKLKTGKQNDDNPADNSFQTIANIFGGGEFL
ncbi:MAG TPA: kelch repeat-containing protein, partial [Ignavibacteriaceae bacterium]